MRLRSRFALSIAALEVGGEPFRVAMDDHHLPRSLQPHLLTTSKYIGRQMGRSFSVKTVQYKGQKCISVSRTA